MEIVRQSYPMRSVIRCKAKQLLASSSNDRGSISLDETLFREVVTTFFKSSQFQAVYQPYQAKSEVSAVEDGVAERLAETYRQVKSRQADPIVQQLNALL
jgi:hypothetical protein